MKLKHSYLCDIIKVILALIGFVVFTTLVAACAVSHSYILAAVFLVLDIVYMVLMVKNLAIVTIDEENVRMKVLGRTILNYEWKDVKAAGMINKSFIYISDVEMTDDDLHRMCFNWPPKDKIYFRASKKGIKHVEKLWNRQDKLFRHYKPRRFHYI